MDDVDIVTATVEDAEAVVDLWIALADDQRAHDSHILAAENRTRIRESILRHAVDDRLLVARAPEVVGFAMFSVQCATYRQDVQRGVVENIYVEPERRREGFGAALLAAVEEQLRDRGADVVGLETMAANDAARRFYRRQGYQPHRLALEKPVQSDTHSKGDE